MCVCTTVCHEILVELQQLVSDVLWTGTLLLLILKAEQHVNLRKTTHTHTES